MVDELAPTKTLASLTLPVSGVITKFATKNGNFPRRARRGIGEVGVAVSRRFYGSWSVVGPRPDDILIAVRVRERGEGTASNARLCSSSNARGIALRAR